MLADRVNKFDSTVLREAFRKQSELINPIDLGVGYPEDTTAKHISEAGIQAIKDDNTRYTPANGNEELREAIACKLRATNNILSSKEMVTVVPGLTTGMLLAYLALINPGDEIVIMDPYYPPYKELAQMLGAEVTIINTLPTFQPDMEALKASITHKTKVMVINSPNNPTGAVYSKKTLMELADIAEQHNMLVISDEIYEYFSYNKPHFSIGSIYGKTLTLNGFSKAYAMTGWRIGYISGPLEIIEAINELQQYIVFSSSSIAQKAAMSALKHPPKSLNKYATKRKLVCELLTKKGVEVKGAEGAFYVFFKAPNDMTDLEFVDIAINENLLLLPGRAFSERHGYIRLSYGADLNTLKRGLSVLGNLLD